MSATDRFAYMGCPLVPGSDPDHIARCATCLCAWWRPGFGRCAIALLGDLAGDMLLEDQDEPVLICARCGCIDDRPCVDPETGMACAWLADQELPEGQRGPLCSACLRLIVANTERETSCPPAPAANELSSPAA